MIYGGLRVRHKNPKVKGYGITDGWHILQARDIYVFTTWYDDRDEPYGVWMELAGLIVTVKAKSRSCCVKYLQQLGRALRVPTNKQSVLEYQANYYK